MNLNLTCETLDWHRKWLVDFNARKIQLVLFDRSKNTGAIDVKMDEHVLEEKSSELAELVPLPCFRGRSTHYSDKLHHFSVTIPKCCKDVYVNSFFPHSGRL